MKHISIRQFLSERGIFPKQEHGGYGMYLSPLRNERTPSFKVDYNKNLWYDFGTGEGGSIIDLVMAMERCDFRAAVTKLETSDSFSFHRAEPAQYANFTQSTVQIYSIKPLQDIRLINYLQSKRCINIDIAREYCREVHYTTNHSLPSVFRAIPEVGNFATNISKAAPHPNLRPPSGTIQPPVCSSGALWICSPISL